MVLSKVDWTLMKRINDALMTTLAACGDVNRNVMAPPTPVTESWMEEVMPTLNVCQMHFAHDSILQCIWVEGVQLNLTDHQGDDLSTQNRYLANSRQPLPFLLSMMDLFTNCLGFIAIEEGKLVGYKLTAGGGLE